MAPGAAIAVGCGDTILADFSVEQAGQPVVSPSETEYDLASVSKMFTATAVLMLAQKGDINLDAPVGQFLVKSPQHPTEYLTGEKAKVTFRMLLQHRSGLPDVDYSKLTAGTTNPAEVWQRMYDSPLTDIPGNSYVYSNIGFNILFSAATEAAHQPLENFIRDNIFKPLGMTHSLAYSTFDGKHYSYTPPATNCAPTTADNVVNNPDNNPPRDASLPINRLCQPQDDLAYHLGGVGGHAGWFTTATDEVKFMAMLADGGTYNGHHILTSASVAEMSATQPDAPYGMGVRTNAGGLFGKLMSPRTVGHTGWNGTEAADDPTTELEVVMLTNGTYQRVAPEVAGYNAFIAITNAFVTATDQLKRH